jgi:hypothetical protein
MVKAAGVVNQIYSLYFKNKKINYCWAFGSMYIGLLLILSSDQFSRFFHFPLYMFFLKMRSSVLVHICKTQEADGHACQYQIS